MEGQISDEWAKNKTSNVMLPVPAKVGKRGEASLYGQRIRRYDWTFTTSSAAIPIYVAGPVNSYNIKIISSMPDMSALFCNLKHAGQWNLQASPFHLLLP